MLKKRLSRQFAKNSPQDCFFNAHVRILDLQYKRDRLSPIPIGGERGIRSALLRNAITPVRGNSPQDCCCSLTFESLVFLRKIGLTKSALLAEREGFAPFRYASLSRRFAKNSPQDCFFNAHVQILYTFYVNRASI